MIDRGISNHLGWQPTLQLRLGSLAIICAESIKVFSECVVKLRRHDFNWTTQPNCDGEVSHA
eukprot:SAG11_NODE_22167_length_411_cov_0.570513_1_plen_61_part_10